MLGGSCVTLLRKRLAAAALTALARDHHTASVGCICGAVFSFAIALRCVSFSFISLRRAKWLCNALTSSRNNSLCFRWLDAVRYKASEFSLAFLVALKRLIVVGRVSRSRARASTQKPQPLPRSKRKVGLSLVYFSLVLRWISILPRRQSQSEPSSRWLVVQRGE